MCDNCSSMPTIEEMRESLGLEPNFIIVFGHNGFIVHMIAQENKPEQYQIHQYFEELATDEEFDLGDIIHEIRYVVLDQEGYINMVKEIEALETKGEN